ncbi:hypothetical protein BAXH7_03702 [Bacillus amyloliquefaciens XH7]|nr:hypothetical protein BAXH7_03702 [Bacillus amyloliquefaciens XH7]KYC99028.1 hypothetical protein B425_3498 [Bacillus amyloliquefaciens]QBG58044.1 hypothetical protein D2M30_3745 [Bacillus amyloliquefaciens]
MTEHSALSEWYNEQVSHLYILFFNCGSLRVLKKIQGEWDMSRFLRGGERT